MRLFLSILAPLLLSSLFAAAQDCQSNDVRTPLPIFSPHGHENMSRRGANIKQYIANTNAYVSFKDCDGNFVCGFCPDSGSGCFDPCDDICTSITCDCGLGKYSIPWPPPCRWGQLWYANLWLNG